MEKMNCDARAVAFLIGFKNDIGKPLQKEIVFNNGIYQIYVTGSNSDYCADYETKYHIYKKGVLVEYGEYIDIRYSFTCGRFPQYVFDKISKINKYMELYAC